MPKNHNKKIHKTTHINKSRKIFSIEAHETDASLQDISDRTYYAPALGRIYLREKDLQLLINQQTAHQQTAPFPVHVESTSLQCCIQNLRQQEI